MHRICIMNYKGGTGKTTVAVNFAHGLALAGKSVLLVDTDPQGSVGYYLGLEPKRTLYDLLMEGASVADCIVNARPGLDVICANERLFPAEMRLAQTKNREMALSRALSGVTDYDFIIVDTPPSMNLMNQNSLLFCRDIYLPVSMEYLALVGVKQLLMNVKMINRMFGNRVRIGKVIPTFFDRRLSKSFDILESLNRAFPTLVTTPVRACVSISESAGRQQTVFEGDGVGVAIEDFRKLVEEELNGG